MKKAVIFLVVISITILINGSAFRSDSDFIAGDKVVQDTVIIYKDGSYEGRSRSLYTAEPYWGILKITVRDSLFTNISFMIRDSALHETFNEKYEIHFEGNPLYIQQCRNDWKGVLTYPVKLGETQHINKVDAMSGATWSYNIFKASFGQALKNAK